MSRRKALKGNKFFLFLSSLQITVVGLLLLFILTFWGTVAQVENGLYASQERYFSSFYFLAMGFLPFPGAQLVLWILFVNLFCAFFTRVIYAWENSGLIIVHFGLVLFLVAAFVTLHAARESHLTLREGQASNVSLAYSEWEIAVWSKSDKQKTVSAVDVKNLKEGGVIKFNDLPLSFSVVTYYKNAEAFSAPFAGIKEKYLNASNINVLKPENLQKEPEKNTPGIILKLLSTDEKPLVLLYGADEGPTKISVGDKEFNVSLRFKRFPLPITVKLLDFMMDKHPGTQMARSYKSKVEIQHDDVKREMMISMNEPLRFKDYTFYQSSYNIDSMGREFSTLAVVKNAGRLLPYIATFVTFFGLALHFLLAAFNFQRARK